MSLKDKKILVGLTGGIACYKTPYLIRLLGREGASVRVVMTRAATKLITPLTLETVSGHPVAVELFPEGEFAATRHIDLAEWADLITVAPATANFLGKAAGGIADDLLTTIICATPRPVMVAPAMNPGMWSSRVTQKNYAYLKELGYFFVGPTEGEMACDDYGVGRMAEPEQIFEAVKCFLSGNFEKRLLAGKKVLVTAGPTREALDPVRFLSNYSSGRMGFALAQAALLLGAETTLISGPTSLMPPAGAKLISIKSTSELSDSVKKEFKQSDCLIMAAAPADFTPASVAAHKIKKAAAGWTLAFEPTVDILKGVAAKKKASQLVVGFALETENAVANARKKLKEKNLDMLVLNQPGDKTGFAGETNRVTILMPGKKPDRWPLMDKREIAGRLLAKIAAML